MKKILKIAVVMAVVIISQSFTTDMASKIHGTYGVSSKDHSRIKLVINEDHTFSYQDFSDQNNKIDTQGTWENKNQYVQLKSNKPNVKFHDKWKVSNNGAKAKSRKGLTYYTLCRVNLTK